MGRGFLAGIFWGGVVGAGLLLVSNQTMDRQQLSFPKPEASPVDVPGGSEFDQARAETEPVLPGTEETPGADEIVTGVLPPTDVVETPPAFDTSSLDVPQPSVEGPSGLGDVPAVADEVAAPESGESDRVGSSGNLAGVPASPSLETPETPITAPETDTASPLALDAPETEGLEVSDGATADTAPVAETEVAALPAETGDSPPVSIDSAPAIETESDGPASPAAPQVGDAPTLEGVRMPEPEPAPADTDVAAQPDAAQPEAPVLAPTPPSAPEVSQPEPDVARTEQPEAPAVAPEVAETPDSGGVATVDGSDSQFFTPVETFQDRAEGVEVNRLPTIGGDDDTIPVVRRLPGTPATEGLVPETEEDGTEDSAGATATAEGPALRAFAMEFDVPAGAAVVSVVLLHEGPAALSDADLRRLPQTVGFAVDAGSPEAEAIAADYRRAGREVVMIPSLPSGASPQDVEVALSVNLERIPEAVAVIDVSGSSFQSDRDAVAQVVAVIGDTGHGLITFPRGLNTAHQQAERAGLPTGLIFRMLDDDNETDEQIRRTLDRAAFRARQSDAVILVGHARPGTIAAVSAWAADAGGDVTLAPVSVALEGE